MTYPNLVVVDLKIPCNGNIEGASAYVSISRAQSWHQIYLLRELRPKNDDDAKLQYIQKLRNHSLVMMKTLKLAKFDWINSQFLQLFFAAKPIFIISHKQIQKIVLFAARLQVLCIIRF
jgi:hypothetical protein